MAHAPMLIDVTRLAVRRARGRLPTGVDRVALAWVERYALGLHTDEPVRPHTRALLRAGPLQGCLPSDASARLFRWLAPAAPATPAAPPAAGPDRRAPWVVNAAHSGLEREDWAAAARARGARGLVVVHDLIPITHPQHCRAGEAERHARRMRHALRWSRALVANSRATLDTLTDWAADQGLAVPPATVAHLGLDAGVGPQAPSVPAPVPDLPNGWFVMLGTVEPRKNHLLALRVWESLVRAHGHDAVPRLVVIGQAGWEAEHVERQLQRNPWLQRAVVVRRGCTDAERAGWLRGARALLFPSEAEGFGLPLVEALASGLPVLASPLPAFREVAGDIPEYLDTLDGTAWRQAVLAYAQPDAPARERQLQRMRRFRAPTWREHFAAVDALVAAVDARDARDGAGVDGRLRPAVGLTR